MSFYKFNTHISFYINITLGDTQKVYQKDIWRLYTYMNSNTYFLTNYFNISKKLKPLYNRTYLS